MKRSSLNLIRSPLREAQPESQSISETEDQVYRLNESEVCTFLASVTHSLVKEHYDDALKRLPQVRLSFDSFCEKVGEVLEKHLLLSPGKEIHSSLVERANQLLAGLKWEELFLTTACAEGDEAAWVTFQSRYQGAIRKTARYCAENAFQGSEISESLMTDLFLPIPCGSGKRLSKIAQYDGMGSLEGWIRVVVSRMAIDQIRKNQKQVSLEAMENEPVETKPVSHNVGSECELELQKATAMFQASLNYALDQLTSQEKLVLKLYYLQDTSLKEIGVLLKVHESTASRIITRIKKQIRKSVEKHLQSFFHIKRGEIGHLIAAAHNQIEIELDRALKE